MLAVFDLSSTIIFVPNFIIMWWFKECISESDIDIATLFAMAELMTSNWSSWMLKNWKYLHWHLQRDQPSFSAHVSVHYVVWPLFQRAGWEFLHLSMKIRGSSFTRTKSLYSHSYHHHVACWQRQPCLFTDLDPWCFPSAPFSIIL